MASTFTCLNYHVISGTKCREPYLNEAVRERLFPYLGGVARDHGFVCLQANGVSDHVHLLLAIPPAMAVSEAMKTLKGISSRWIHESFAQLASFAWQDGFGAFTVSRSNLEDVQKYIANQVEHHKTVSFYDEYKLFLVRHGIEFDEKYLLG